MIKFRSLMSQIDNFISSPEAIVITGMRRTGKTTLLMYYFEQTNTENKIFIDLENIINRKFFEEENYEKIKKNLEFLGIDFSKKAYIFIDEIQFLRNVPSIVKYFIDHYGVKFFLTGSASFYLRNLFNESLADRKIVFELFPLTFQEFLIFKDIQLKIPSDTAMITKPIFDIIAPLYEEYIQYGGFPGVVLKNSVEEKRKTLEDIFNSYFQLEVQQLGDFRKNEAIRELILLI